MMKKTFCYACQLFAFLLVSGCFPTPEIDDLILKKEVSPSQKIVAYVVRREVILADTSILVFVGPISLDIKKVDPVLAVTEGTIPEIKFIDNHTLEVHFFAGIIHNQRFQANGINIIYK